VQSTVVDLRIGLDIGTSCSKVAIGDSHWDRFYGVVFAPRAKSVTKYLIPTRFYEPPQAATLHPLDGATPTSNIKLRLVDAVARGSDETDAALDLAIYIALVLQHTFDWYQDNHAQEHRARQPCWWLNIGFPAKRLQNNPKLADLYSRAAKAAIRAVDSGKSITRELVRVCMTTELPPSNTPQRLADERLSFYPEIAAQLAGYTYSPYRSEAPLLLLDVGAGTLDISTLILHKNEGEDVCSFQFCEVAQLGAFRLYQRIHDALRTLSPAQIRSAVSIGEDPGWRIPDCPAGYLLPDAITDSSLQNAYHNARSTFASDCLDVCRANFVAFKRFLDEPFQLQKRRPVAFREKVNFILSGGGSRAGFYLDLFPQRLEQHIINLTCWEVEPYRRRNLGQGLHRIHFMHPARFVADDVGAEDFDRLSVAHGLSMGVETLMRITARESSDKQWGL
jgi:hypothetical protein